MRVLSLSLDAQVVNPDSVVASRARRYGEVVDRYTVIVPALRATQIELSKSVQVYAVAGATKLFTFFRIFWYARQILRKEKYEVLTTQDAYFLGLLGVLLCVWYGSALEVQAHGIEKDTFLRRRLARFVYARAHFVRTVSTRLKKELIEKYDVAEEKIVVVPVFVDVSSLGIAGDQVSPAMSALVTSFKEKYGNYFNVCSAARLVEVKNISLQLRALARLQHVHPEVHLHITGEGPLRASLEKEARNLGVSSNVTFHGHLTGLELGSVYLASNAFVHTSYSEGYGMALVEALHAGLPIVTTDVGIVGDIILKDVHALVVDFDNDSMLTDALAHLCSNASLSSRLGIEAKKKSTELDTFDIVLKKYVSAWERARICAQKR